MLLSVALTKVAHQGTEKTGFVLSLSMHPLHVWMHKGRQQHGQLQQPHITMQMSTFQKQG